MQLRQELGQRLIEKVFDPQTDKPSKVCHFTFCHFTSVVFHREGIALFMGSGRPKSKEDNFI